jgi:hypothetical protein
MKKGTMAMPPKPKQETPFLNVENPELLAMIASGGGTKAEMKPLDLKADLSDEIKHFSIRLFNSELEEIKNHIKGFGGRKTKSIHTFILEGIREKLDREKV